MHALAADIANGQRHTARQLPLDVEAPLVGARLKIVRVESIGIDGAGRAEGPERFGGGKRVGWQGVVRIDRLGKLAAARKWWIQGENRVVVELGDVVIDAET